MTSFLVSFGSLVLFVSVSILLVWWLPDDVNETVHYARYDDSDCNVTNINILKKSAIVYTWVNGTEECYTQRRLKAKLSPGGSSRDKEIGELQYSIRSLIKFVPWLEGPIYIVTPGHIPNWLDMGNPRVKVIDQDDLFPDKGALPNFNTNAIEQFLYRIPGLTDIFIHMNDDYLFIKETPPSKLFTCDGGLRFLTEINHIRHVQGDKSNAWLASVRNTVKLTDKTYGGQHVYNFLKHAPFVYSKKAFVQIHDKFSDDLRKTVHHKVRDAEDINIPLLHHIYMTEEGSKKLNLPIAYNPIKECDDWKLIVLRDDNRNDLTAIFDRIIAKKATETLVALNDEYKEIETAKLVKRFYEKFLPERPTHELAVGAPTPPSSNRFGENCDLDLSLLPLPKEETPTVDMSVLSKEWNTVGTLETFFIRLTGLLCGCLLIAFVSRFFPQYREQQQFLEEMGLLPAKRMQYRE